MARILGSVLLLVLCLVALVSAWSPEGEISLSRVAIAALESQVTDSWQTMKFSVFKTKSPSTKAVTSPSTPSLE